jgi:hypothetical protein
MSSLHKAASIAHLFNPAKTKALFLFAGIHMAGTRRLLFKQDAHGNTFLHLLWNSTSKSGSIQAIWKTYVKIVKQWQQYTKSDILRLQAWNIRGLDPDGN